MSDLQIEPLEEPEQDSLFGTVVLRFIVAFICALLGFGFVLVGYAVALYLDIDVTEFGVSTSAYFIVSIVIWIMIGLSTPFKSMSRVFEEFKGVSAVRIAVFILVFAFFVLLYWYLITFIVSIIMSVIGVE
jgi:hypothetical protein